MIEIDKISMDFQSNNPNFARRLYADWTPFCLHSIEQVIDHQLSIFDQSEEVILVDQLEVNVGDIPEEDFYDLFPKHFARALKEQFTFLLKKQEEELSTEASIQIISTQKSGLYFFIFFLRYGHIPAVVSHSYSTPSALLKQALKVDRQLFRKAFEQEWHQQFFCERFVQQLTDSELQQVVEVLLPEEEPFISFSAMTIIKTQPLSNYFQLPQTAYRMVVWVVVFSFLIETPGSNFNRQTYLTYLIRKLAAHYNLEYQKLLIALFHQLAKKEQKPYVSELLKWLTIIVRQEKLEEQLFSLTKNDTLYNQTQTAFSQDRKKIDSVNSDGEDLDRKSLDRESQNQEKQDIDKSNREKNKEEAENNRKESNNQNTVYQHQNTYLPEKAPLTRVLIPNAGLVLLAPYIPTLFNRLALLNDQLEFETPTCRIRAVFVLQQLLFDHWDGFPETELILNKVLTGLDLGESPLPSFIALNETEKNICKSLLEAIKTNWPKMKNTSIEGIRSAFLRRNGTLEEKEETWELRIEENAYDMLIDSIPWQFRLIKFSWMAKPISVKWR